MRWQVQAWIDELMLKVDPKEGSIRREEFGVEAIVLTARNLVNRRSLATTVGNRSAEDTRGATNSVSASILVGVDGVRQPGCDQDLIPSPKLLNLHWGEVEQRASWEDWQLPKKWSEHASFQPDHQWIGEIDEESPATVLEELIPVTLFDESEQTRAASI